MAHAAAKLSNLFNAALPTNVSLNYDMKYYPFDLYFRLFISIKKKKNFSRVYISPKGKHYSYSFYSSSSSPRV